MPIYELFSFLNINHKIINQKKQKQNKETKIKQNIPIQKLKRQNYWKNIGISIKKAVLFFGKLMSLFPLLILGTFWLNLQLFFDFCTK